MEAEVAFQTCVPRWTHLALNVVVTDRLQRSLRTLGCQVVISGCPSDRTRRYSPLLPKEEGSQPCPSNTCPIAPVFYHSGLERLQLHLFAFPDRFWVYVLSSVRHCGHTLLQIRTELNKSVDCHNLRFSPIYQH
jgi:hypothetical protein